jgi:hypothetical protein
MASDPGATYHQTVIKLCNQTDNHLYADLYWSAPMILNISWFLWREWVHICVSPSGIVLSFRTF